MGKEELRQAASELAEAERICREYHKMLNTEPEKYRTLFESARDKAEQLRKGVLEMQRQTPELAEKKYWARILPWFRAFVTLETVYIRSP